MTCLLLLLWLISVWMTHCCNGSVNILTPLSIATHTHPLITHRLTTHPLRTHHINVPSHAFPLTTHPLMTRTLTSQETQAMLAPAFNLFTGEDSCETFRRAMKKMSSKGVTSASTILRYAAKDLPEKVVFVFVLCV